MKLLDVQYNTKSKSKYLNMDGKVVALILLLSDGGCLMVVEQLSWLVKEK